MLLAIDVGNTNSKFAVFNGDQIVAHRLLERATQLQDLGMPAGVDQALLGLGHGVLQDHDDGLAVDRRTRLGRPSPRVLGEDVDHRGGDGGGHSPLIVARGAAVGRRGHCAPVLAPLKGKIAREAERNEKYPTAKSSFYSWARDTVTCSREPQPRRGPVRRQGLPPTRRS